MPWFDFGDLVTDYFNMSEDAAVRFFAVEDGGTIAGQKQPSTYVELTFLDYAFVPNAPKNFYAQLPADKRERDYCLVWMTDNEASRLTTVKQADGTNAGRIYDVERDKFYIVSKEYDYLRQGNLNGVIGALIDGATPGDLPDPP